MINPDKCQHSLTDAVTRILNARGGFHIWYNNLREIRGDGPEAWEIYQSGRYGINNWNFIRDEMNLMETVAAFTGVPKDEMVDDPLWVWIQHHSRHGVGFSGARLATWSTHGYHLYDSGPILNYHLYHNGYPRGSGRTLVQAMAASDDRYRSGSNLYQNPEGKCIIFSGPVEHSEYPGPFTRRVWTSLAEADEVFRRHCRS